MAERIGDVARVAHSAVLEQHAALGRHELGGDVARRLARVPRQGVEQPRNVGGAHGPGDERRLPVSRDGDGRSGPAHPVAAGGDDRERKRPARDLVAESLQRGGGADGHRAGADAHGDPGARAPPAGPAHQRREALGRRSRDDRERGDDRCGAMSGVSRR